MDLNLSQDQRNLGECCLVGVGRGVWDVSHTDLKELVAKFHLHSIRTLPQSTQWRIGLLEGDKRSLTG